jgi:phosphoribosylformylglycinamidine synthase
MNLIHFFRTPALSEEKKDTLLAIIRQKISPEIQDIHSEFCFNIEIKDLSRSLTQDEIKLLTWLLNETFQPENFSDKSFLAHYTSPISQYHLIEVGPRMNFTTAWSTNAVSICHACGLTPISRIERSRRYMLETKSSLRQEQIEDFLKEVHDRMTECRYSETLTTFETGIKPEPVCTIPLIEHGKQALEKINSEMGLGLDEWDIDYYYNLFVNDIKRNPTNVECFDLSQSNSEHSRHWFFKGRLIVAGKEIPNSLIGIIKQPLKANGKNSVIAFKDNASAIRGYDIQTIVPEFPGKTGRFRKTSLLYHITFTAETHNFPSGVAPFPGAETGTGGRIRDVEAVGRGGLVVAGTAAYCVGNLHIPDYELPWEDSSFQYPNNLALPRDIEIQASNGASDYGNKFGEPVIQGFTRSFGVRLSNGERYEWIKPIMFTGGIGQMDSMHTEKLSPEKGMLVVKIGGPAYRIGIGGGAASSMIHGENIPELDFNAVQRGDAEMEQKLNRVLRACLEMEDRNPIISIHDQGAGGNCNVVKEIIYPEGAKIDIRSIQLGDNTLSVLEIWGAEYQEQNALLLRQEDIDSFQDICVREKVPCAVIGQITGDGFIILHDQTDGSTPVNLELEKILGDMPRKTFHLNRIERTLQPLKLAETLTLVDALQRVLRLLSVGSKRFLTNKVDRSVTGLITQQQCAGPLQLTLSDVAVISQSHFGKTGAATAIGEQPIKGLINPGAMARMSVGEAITNIIWAKISSLEDIKCSANWMWAAKLPGEGISLYEAAAAMCDIMMNLGIAVDGGKDSLSMAAQAPHPYKKGETERVKSPGTLVISAYAPCPDITKVVTPDLKKPGQSKLLYIDLGQGKNRLGGTALAQVFSQIGDETPDVDDPALLKRAFHAVQQLISRELILSGHDRSDGGLAITLLEMAFAGNCGLEIELSAGEGSALSCLFSEELGLVIEYVSEKETEIVSVLNNLSIPYIIIGSSLSEKRIKIHVQTLNSKRQTLLDKDMRELRNTWEETSYRLDMLQANPACVEEERKINYL